MKKLAVALPAMRREGGIGTLPDVASHDPVSNGNPEGWGESRRDSPNKLRLGKDDRTFPGTSPAIHAMVSIGGGRPRYQLHHKCYLGSTIMGDVGSGSSSYREVMSPWSCRTYLA